MGRFEDILWVEDVATNGGAAAIAANLNQFGGYTITGTDQIDAVRIKGLMLMRIMTSDETVNTAPLPGDIALTTRREGDISLPFETNLSNPGVLDLTPGVVLPPAEGMNVLANQSGAGAEEHAIACRIWNPDAKSDFTVSAPPTSGIEIQINEMPTDANTAVTMDNFVDITGRLNAYTNGQVALPDDQRVEIWLKAITTFVPAAMAGIAIGMPSLNHVYVYPAAALGLTRIDFEQEFGGALYCTADAPIVVGGIGNGAAAVPLILEMIVKRPQGV
jgi:hypothetical protein